MREYYQQSLVTIFAGIASPENGLAVTEKVEAKFMPRLARLPYRNHYGERQGFFYLYEPPVNLDTAYENFFMETDLFRRGWVFQEWCLSRRVIYFASEYAGKRVFFHCQSQGPRNELGDMIPTNVFWSKSNKIHAITNWTSLWSSWRESVESYSATQLSEPSKDRMIAVAGVANEFRAKIISLATSMKLKRPNRPYADVSPPVFLEPQDRYIDSYVAGLWIRNIHAELLWEQKAESETLASQRIDGLPSWSWASMLIPVMWRGNGKEARTLTSLSSIISEDGQEHSANRQIRIQNEPEDQMTPNSVGVDQKWGILVFRGRLVPVVVRDDFSAETWRDIARLPELATYEKTEGCYKHHQIAQTRKICLDSNPVLIIGWGSFEHPDMKDEESFSSNGAIFAFPLSGYRGSVGDDMRGYATEVFNVIFIRSVQYGGIEHFERIGVGRLCGQLVQKSFDSAVERDIRLC